MIETLQSQTTDLSLFLICQENSIKELLTRPMSNNCPSLLRGEQEQIIVWLQPIYIIGLLSVRCKQPSVFVNVSVCEHEEHSTKEKECSGLIQVLLTRISKGFSLSLSLSLSPPFLITLSSSNNSKCLFTAFCAVILSLSYSSTSAMHTCTLRIHGLSSPQLSKGLLRCVQKRDTAMSIPLRSRPNRSNNEASCHWGYISSSPTHLSTWKHHLNFLINYSHLAKIQINYQPIWQTL